MFSQLGQFADLMRNAGKIRESMEKATESLGQVEVEGSSGGGVVVAKMNGRMELISIRIDPKLVEQNDVEMLEDLVVAAINQAMTKAQAAVSETFSSSLGGMPMSGLSGLLGGKSD